MEPCGYSRTFRPPYRPVDRSPCTAVAVTAVPHAHTGPHYTRRHIWRRLDRRAHIGLDRCGHGHVGLPHSRHCAACDHPCPRRPAARVLYTAAVLSRWRPSRWLTPMTRLGIAVPPLPAYGSACGAPPAHARQGRARRSARRRPCRPCGPNGLQGGRTGHPWPLTRRGRRGRRQRIRRRRGVCYCPPCGAAEGGHTRAFRGRTCRMKHRRCMCGVAPGGRRAPRATDMPVRPNSFVASVCMGATWHMPQTRRASAAAWRRSASIPDP